MVKGSYLGGSSVMQFHPVGQPANRQAGRKGNGKPIDLGPTPEQITLAKQTLRNIALSEFEKIELGLVGSAKQNSLALMKSELLKAKTAQMHDVRRIANIWNRAGFRIGKVVVWDARKVALVRKAVMETKP